MKARKNNYLAIPKGVELSETGLKIAARLSYEDWFELGKTLQAVHRSVLFWAGDWLLWGERKWGEKYSQAIDVTGYSAQTLMNAQWVASRIEISRRSRDLSWSHHQEVAMLQPDEQDRFLQEAAGRDWGVRQLRAAVRLFRKPEPKADFHDEPDPPVVIHTSEEGEEYPEVGEQILPSERPSIESDFRHLLDLCRALRSAEKRRDEGDAIRLRTALDVFIAGHDGA